LGANPAVDPRRVESYVAVTSPQTFPVNLNRRAFLLINPEQAHLSSEPVVSTWCMSPFKRIFDLACVIPALLLLSPAMLTVAFLVRLTSDGPILFRQLRVGLHRRTFTIYKFRTMFHDIAGAGPCVTKTGDTRLTRIGHFLRKYKLDEFPQLYNVLCGDMSLVGPRPKLPQHEHLEMHYRPGVTGAATLAFANEELMLKDVPDEKLEEFHINVVSPIKMLLDRRYQEQATFISDFRLLLDTVLKRRACLDIHDLISETREDERTIALRVAEQVGS